jgi:hypothetical protein
MIPYRSNRFATIAFVLFFVSIAGYAYFEARNILYGPQIFVSAPEEGITVTESFVVLRGTTKNIVEIRMNGFPIPVTEEGVFEEPVLLSPGYNAIVFSAQDKLGRETEKEVRIVYQQEEQMSSVE